MPLSDHEQKLLEQMEQALASEDPRFASQMRGAHLLAGRRRRWVLGGLGVVAGLALVLVGVSTTMWVGAAGFALMVASAAFALTPGRTGPALPQGGASTPGGPAGGGGGGGRGPGGGGRGPTRGGRGPAGDGSAKGKRARPGRGGKRGFMERLDDRWERRENDNGGL